MAEDDSKHTRSALVLPSEAANMFLNKARPTRIFVFAVFTSWINVKAYQGLPLYLKFRLPTTKQALSVLHQNLEENEAILIGAKS